MDSNENLEQPKEDSDILNEQPNNTDNIKLNDGTEVSLDELKDGYLRQSDYTKKTQALAEDKKTSENPELDETMKILKEAGVVTKEDIVELKQFKEEALLDKKNQITENEFNDFIGKFETLSENQKIILKDLKKVHSDKSYNDILEGTGFIDQSLLEKSKNEGLVKGASLGIPKEKEEQKIDINVSQKFGLKSKGEINDIRSKFNL